MAAVVRRGCPSSGTTRVPGADMCPACEPGTTTGSGWPARGIPRPGCGATRRNCCWTPTPAPSRERCDGGPRCSGTSPVSRTAATTPIRPASYPGRWWWRPRSRPPRGRAGCRGRTRSSTKPTSRVSPSWLRTCRRRCAAPTPVSARPRPSTICFGWASRPSS